ncbi:TetR/AcrR family transcriptional regulator [Dyella flagellata]|uniref:TetR family transcriptional regulator n=1 Tax=Dyella flagellata TaxID=1867833 RepID=A0ABQ5X6R3_9GAMM|nr:TetR/AcrR family transcriptional regulator [Dyella flagellata]GLQ87275.1 TetR family transcriptional regulator [Dyella flagellata]
MTGSKPTPKSSGRRQRKRQQTASHLAATAFELFEAFGYEAVTMEQITAKADVAKATLYSYFPVKEALVAHRLMDEIAEGMAARADQLAAHHTFVSRMEFLLRESAAWHASKRVYLPHYLRYLHSIVEYGADDARKETGAKLSMDILAAMFRAGQQSGEISRTITAEKLAWSLQYLLYAAVTYWLVHPEADLTDEFLQSFTLLMDGAAADKSTSTPERTQASKKGKRRSR